MPAPFGRIGSHHSIGRDYRQSESAGRGEYRMPLAARPELGIEVLRSTEAEYFFQETNISREHHETIAITCKLPAERGRRCCPAAPPMYLGDSTTERCPPTLIEGQCYGFLSIGNEMG